ncbi:hypothetical protein [Sorangium sp. So ce131]|uniref:hypothetical protein n=1 Tax=Sorangium sp. So ce131 TaxID=3133282 RepID=UPI003F61C8BA
MNHRSSISFSAMLPALMLAGCAVDDASTAMNDEGVTSQAASQSGAGIAPQKGAGIAPQKGASVAPQRDRTENQLSFDVELPARMPDVPEQVTLYKVKKGAPVVDLRALEDAFDVRGAAETTADFGGVTHVRAGARHLYVYDGGGAAYHDVDRIGSEAPITPLSERHLWKDAHRRLGALGLLAAGPVSLVPGRAGVSEAGTMDPSGNTQKRWVTAQSVSFVQRIDGMPTFGGGNDVQIVYAGGGAIASLTSNVRPLEAIESLTIDRPEKAVGRYLDRAERTGRWNLIKAHIERVDRLEITDVRLGYYLPDASVPAKTAEPVYAVHGAAHGVDQSGAQTAIDVLWIEPAAPGRDIPSLQISARDAK